MVKNNTLNLLIAGFVLQIKFYEWEWYFAANLLQSSICSYYKGFLIDGNIKLVDFYINIKESKIFYIKKNESGEGFINFCKFRGNHVTTYYQISILQFQLIIREILLKLLSKNKGFLLHGSANLINNSAIIYLGISGTGKSTIIKLLKKKYIPLADDTVIIKKNNKKWWFYQPPFIEKEHWIVRKQQGYPLAKVFILKKTPYVNIQKITESDIIPPLLVKQLWTLKEVSKIHLKHLLLFAAEFKDFHILSFNKNAKQITQAISGLS